jgi:hypothetical protein
VTSQEKNEGAFILKHGPAKDGAFIDAMAKMNAPLCREKCVRCKIKWERIT